MDVDKKLCEDNSASAQSNAANRTSEEPERIVKVFILFSFILFYLITNA